ncbi:MAG: DUF1697 domain-containing protein [Acidobacteria bacterium]|nr:DUF1697 domain-containing protein [Acidobacteriota bacterium]
MPQRVALLCGINVGRAKRIAMADLRSLFSDLGSTDVRTRCAPILWPRWRTIHLAWSSWRVQTRPRPRGSRR